jgi:hypothetical protein
MAIEELTTDEDFHGWRYAHPSGYILNPKTLKIHTTSCPSLEAHEWERGQLTNTPKLASENRTELELRAHRDSGKRATPCGQCEP